MVSILEHHILNSHRRIFFTLWSEWDVESYLKTYFLHLGPDVYENLRFLIHELILLDTGKKLKILDFGSGPTVFSALLAVPFSREIHISDYLQSNLDEVKKWMDKKRNKFNWDPCIEAILKMELKDSSKKSINQRSTQLRKMKPKLLLCDASLPNPLGAFTSSYDVVICNFCPDSATSSKDIWKIYMKNISSLVKDGGVLLMAALRNCTYYRSGKAYFPSANINENDVEQSLVACDFDDIHVEVVNVEECKNDGFSSIIFARATKESFRVTT